MIDKILRMVDEAATETVEGLEGLSEGEIRQEAIARYGFDAVDGLCTLDMMELFNEY